MVCGACSENLLIDDLYMSKVFEVLESSIVDLQMPPNRQY
jgi:hypothetical protein